MRRALLIWSACSALGVAVLALPDDGPRWVAFSDAHGLTLLDTVGVALLLAGWIPTIRRAAAGRGERSMFERGRVMAFIAGVGAGLVLASTFADFAGWWAVGAALLVGVQLTALTRGRRAD